MTKGLLGSGKSDQIGPHVGGEARTLSSSWRAPIGRRAGLCLMALRKAECRLIAGQGFEVDDEGPPSVPSWRTKNSPS